MSTKPGAIQFAEENVSYRVDERCGVHPLVDQEFERNRASAVADLSAARWGSANASFEQAHEHLRNGDYKGAVREAFDAVESVAKSLVPKAPRLDRNLVLGELLDLVVTRLEADEVCQRSLRKQFDGIADWVDGLHFYRHGQAQETALQPPLEVAVYALSTSASILRLLVSTAT